MIESPSVNPQTRHSPSVNPEPASAPPMNSNHKRFNLLLLIAAVLCILGVGYFAYGNYKLKNQSTQVIPSPNVALLSSPTTDLTSDWKTYMNQKFHYSFKYQESSYLICDSRTDYVLLFKQPMTTNCPEVMDGYPDASVRVVDTTDYRLIKQPRNTISRKIGGLNTKEHTIVYANEDGPNESLGSSRIFEVPVEDTTYEISFHGSGHDSDLINQILSTFEFTSALDPMAEWKTYANATYNLFFKYPPEYSITEYPNVDNNFIQVSVHQNEKPLIGIEAHNEYPPGQTKFFLDTPSNGQKIIADHTWYVFYLAMGYQDGGEASTDPIYALQTEANGVLYKALLGKNEKITPIQTSILESLQF